MMVFFFLEVSFSFLAIHEKKLNKTHVVYQNHFRFDTSQIGVSTVGVITRVLYLFLICKIASSK